MVTDISELVKTYAGSAGCEALRAMAGDASVRRGYVSGARASAMAVMAAGCAGDAGRTCVFVLDDEEEAGYFYNDLVKLTGGGRVLFFPSGYRRKAKYGQKDAANEILRTEVLGRVLSDNGSTGRAGRAGSAGNEGSMAVTNGRTGRAGRTERAGNEGSAGCGQASDGCGQASDGCSHASTAGGGQGQGLYIVTYPGALAEQVAGRKTVADRTVTVRRGQELGMTALARRMRELGFRETDYVYEPGQYAVRGSIIDVFSFACEYPFRIDFFGDEVDSVRTFDVETQLSTGRRETVEIVPELAGDGGARTSLLGYLPDDTLLYMKDYAFCVNAVSKTYEDGFSRQAVQEQVDTLPEIEREEALRRLKRENALVTGQAFSSDAERLKIIEFGAKPSFEPQATVELDTEAQPPMHKNFDLLARTIEDYTLKGYKTYILADSGRQLERIEGILSGEGVKVRLSRGFTPAGPTLHAGYVDNKMKLCLFTDHQIFERFHKYSLRSDAARAGKAALTMKELQEMEPGDYVVHVDYGIGRFAGLVRVPSGGSYQELIRIVYNNNDKVDVSIHSLYKISKYKRKDTDEPPRLSTLGTGAWDRLKEKAKKKMKDMARDLIRLYAARRRGRGFGFSPDGYLQHALEASFAYEDTPDQLKATNEVKADMESSRPMDRLVCGDVGFGKTEVAVRAAFKAACDSKQTAVLVPTTVLAYQHYQTFKKRLKGLPVTVDYLSRARTAKQARQVMADLESGKTDIVIGTHKLIGKSVKFHDLGLLVIDEEQKFGVAVKERLRKLKTNVDTLTMSATPIPRTLQFSLMGARDMSVMRTPPPNRYPVETEVHTFDRALIREAVNFEMSRNGQVFFVNDRISSLPEIAAALRAEVPDARVAVAHGRMKPEELEDTLMAFINYDYDVLLSTTIVENGIDVPNANTIIINDAHRFGLSDLHQMRGRVGRGNRKAFCYLLAPPKHLLTDEARRRLDALETFSQLGSGFNLSMQDLDIRGAGNLLGAEQSGFMEDLGYETYQKILNQAVTELKNDEFQELYDEEMKDGRRHDGGEFVEDCAVESDLEMYLPELYVPGASERMLLYRELDSIETDRDLAQYKARLEDRFGPVPREGKELMHVVALRRMGKALGCEKITLRAWRMRMQFVSNPASPYYRSKAFDKVVNYIGRNPRRCNLKEQNGKRMMTVAQVASVEEAVSILRDIGS